MKIAENMEEFDKDVQNKIQKLSAFKLKLKNAAVGNSSQPNSPNRISNRNSKLSFHHKA